MNEERNIDSWLLALDKSLEAENKAMDARFDAIDKRMRKAEITQLMQMSVVGILVLLSAMVFLGGVV